MWFWKSYKLSLFKIPLYWIIFHYISQNRLGYAAVTNKLYISVAYNKQGLILTHVFIKNELGAVLCHCRYCLMLEPMLMEWPLSGALPIAKAEKIKIWGNTH